MTELMMNDDALQLLFSYSKHECDGNNSVIRTEKNKRIVSDFWT